MSEILLEVQELNVKYGNVAAVTDVSLSVHSGEAVGLIGPNGAGKTSLVDGLTGFAPVTGTRKLNGKIVSPVIRPQAIAHLGLVRTFQSLELFDDLTVRRQSSCRDRAQA